jgi:hypothetical protein
MQLHGGINVTDGIIHAKETTAVEMTFWRHAAPSWVTMIEQMPGHRQVFSKKRQAGWAGPTAALLYRPTDKR